MSELEAQRIEEYAADLIRDYAKNAVLVNHTRYFLELVRSCASVAIGVANDERDTPPKQGEP